MRVRPDPENSPNMIIVPGDKSITHRALLLAGMARGRSEIRGALASLDARSTARVLRHLGVAVGPIAAGRTVTVIGRGRFRASPNVLHCGNSGTTARLLLGLLAAHGFRATLTGDRSLRRRPMRRVTEPLSLMGAQCTPPLADQLPIGTLPLEPGQAMQLVYDFGDNWQFTVKLERIEPPGSKAKGPRILESHGTAPSQYQDWEG